MHKQSNSFNYVWGQADCWELKFCHVLSSTRAYFDMQNVNSLGIASWKEIFLQMKRNLSLAFPAFPELYHFKPSNVAKRNGNKVWRFACIKILNMSWTLSHGSTS